MMVGPLTLARPRGAQGSRPHLGWIRALILAVPILTAAACAGTLSTGPGKAPVAPASADDPSRIARATDPDRDADPCSGYALDGVSLGKPRSDVEASLPIVPVPASLSRLEGFEKSTFQFRAVRQGRADDLQVGFEGDGKDAKVERLRARIRVSKTDSWPASLFRALGSPKRAIVDEWIWWDLSCGATLRLVKVSFLGGGESAPYILEIKKINAPPL